MRQRKASGDAAAVAQTEIDAALFRGRLQAWYREHARALPWRGTADPYRIWVSEIMLQQTRVAAVVEHYHEFLRRFPTLLALALAPEADVLAAWSGLGYYRRARMLHKAAQFIALERDGQLPATAAELRTLPGIGEYTAAAIASIAFGESVAVLDGNVERVLLRLTGRATADAAAAPSSSPSSKPAAVRAFLQAQAQALVPHRLVGSALAPAAPDPVHPVDQRDGRPVRGNAAGDHNQAMMELGATFCLPREPLCLMCPVVELCRTRGEHRTAPRPRQLSRPIACLLDLRKRGPVTEVLLLRRPDDASLMPSMYELPPLPVEVVEGLEPALRLRHAITNTNYYVQVFAPRRAGQRSTGPQPSPQASGAEVDRPRSGRNPPGPKKTSPHSDPSPAPASVRVTASALRGAVPASARELHWLRTSRLPGVPLTGLARKILQRLDVMATPRLSILEQAPKSHDTLAGPTPTRGRT